MMERSLMMKWYERFEKYNTTFKTVAQMIQLMIPYTTNFTKETFLGRLEATKFDLKQSKELDKVETTLSALIFKPTLAKNTRAQEDIASSSKSIEEKYLGRSGSSCGKRKRW